MLLALSLLSFIVTFLSTKLLIKKCHSNNLLSIDMHKPSKPKVADFGGLAVYFGLLIPLCIYAFQNPLALSIISAISIAALLGFLGDIFKFSQKTNAILPILAALPFFAANIPTYIYFPFIGKINFGIFYYLLLLLGATGSANAVNMLAGYNGIEATLSLLITFGLLTMSILQNSQIGITLSLIFISSLLAFLYFNFYPAKIFPGDSGTFLFGITLFSIAITTKLEFFAVLLFALYFINAALYFYTRVRGIKIQKFATVNKEGRLNVEHPSCLYYLLIKWFKPTEKQLLLIFFVLQLLITLAVPIIFMLSFNWG